MDAFKDIEEKELNLIMGDTSFQKDLLVKDYYLTLILYLIKDIEGIYFKGGTALQKTLLDYSRLSEDIDLTLTRDLLSLRKEMITAIKGSGIFGSIHKDKDVTGFVRLI